MNNGMEQDLQALRGDWEKVGGYMLAAMQDVARELGGAELALQVSEASVSDETLPNPAALQLLEDLYPGSADRVMTRSSEIQAESHKGEIEELRKSGIRKYGKVMLNGFARLSNFGTSRRKVL